MTNKPLIAGLASVAETTRSRRRSAADHRFIVAQQGASLRALVETNRIAGNHKAGPQAYAERYLGQSTTLRTQQSGAANFARCTSIACHTPSASQSVGQTPTRRPGRKPAYE